MNKQIVTPAFERNSDEFIWYVGWCIKMFTKSGYLTFNNNNNNNNCNEFYEKYSITIQINNIILFWCFRFERRQNYVILGWKK